jgi:hypothetical protein
MVTQLDMSAQRSNSCGVALTYSRKTTPSAHALPAVTATPVAHVNSCRQLRPDVHPNHHPFKHCHSVHQCVFSTHLLCQHVSPERIVLEVYLAIACRDVGL